MIIILLLILLLITIKFKIHRLKIFQLVLYSDHYPYNNMLPILQNYYRTFPDIKTYFYCFSETIQDEYVLIENVLYIKGGPETLTNTMEKTMKAFEYFRREIEECDYFLRSSISTIIDLELFSKEMRHRTIDYGGHVKGAYHIHHPSGMSDTSLLGIPYYQGICIILSNEMCKLILNNLDKVEIEVVDDTSFGLFVHRFKKNARYGSLDSMFSPPDDIQYIDNYTKKNSIIIYRNKNNDREIDIRNMDYITKKLMYTKYFD